MTFFPETFFVGLVYTAIALTAGGTILLLTLLAKDIKDGKLW